MDKKLLLLLIDFQNDFVLPDGKLSVKGALDDADLISSFILWKGNKFKSVLLSLDSHLKNSISLPCFWMNKEKEHPSPYTKIHVSDIEDGRYTAFDTSVQEKYLIHYLSALEGKGMEHVIWPEHCLIGTSGHAVHQSIMNSIGQVQDKCPYFQYTFLMKGINRMTDAYSMFQSLVPIDESQETLFNHSLIKQLETFDEIFVAGEAADVCVKYSIADLIEKAPSLVPRLVIMENAMSPISKDFDIHTDDVYQRALDMGAKILTVQMAAHLVE